MKVKFADLVIRVREVEIPDTCPRCGTDLTKPGTLFSFRLEHVPYVVGLKPTVERMLEGLKPKEDAYPPIPDALTYLSCLYCCTEPGAVQISSEEKVLRPDPAEIERLQQETVWAQSVDQLIFGGNNF